MEAWAFLNEITTVEISLLRTEIFNVAYLQKK